MTVNLVRELMRIESRVARRTRVLHTEGRLLRPHVEQTRDDADPLIADAFHRAAHDAVGAQLTPSSHGQAFHRPSRWNRAVGVSRQHTKLPLELEVAPEHLGDCFRHRRRLVVTCERETVGHREGRLRTDTVADDELHLRRFAEWPLGRRRLLLGNQRHPAAETEGREHAEDSGHRRYSNVRWTVRLF